MGISLILLVASSTVCHAGVSSAKKSSSLGNRVALLVGIGNYQNAARLQNPRNDVVDLAKVLTTVGFKVHAVTDSTNQSLDFAINQFVSELHPGDTALFYFSGHGVSVDGENYMVPVEFKAREAADVKYQAYSLSRVVNRMEASGSILNLVIVDACRNNPYGYQRSLSGGLAAMTTSGKGTYLAFATSPGGVASDSPQSRNSVFTAALLRALQKPGSNLDAVFNGVRTEVAQVSNGRQIPWTASSVVGDFTFQVGEASVVASQSPGHGDVQNGGLPKAGRQPEITPAANSVNGRLAVTANAPNGSCESDPRDPNVVTQVDMIYWKAIEASKDPEDFRLYLNKFPCGEFRDIARRRIDDYRVNSRIESQLAKMMEQPGPRLHNSDRALQPQQSTTAKNVLPQSNAITDGSSKSVELEAKTRQLGDQVADLKEREARMYDFGKWCFTTLVALMLGVMGMVWANMKNLIPAKPQPEEPKKPSKSEQVVW